MSCYCVKLPEKFDLLLQTFSYYEKLTFLDWDYVIETISECISDPAFPVQSRNEVMFHLLEKKKLDKTKLVDQPCIPTKPNGRLRRPCELIREESNVSQLYKVTDEVFPDVQSKHLPYLESLGMKTDSLSLEMIVDRAKSLEHDFSLDKVKLLLNLVATSTQQSANLINQLRHCKFLPVLQKPNNSIFTSWFGSKVKLSEPVNTFSIDFKNVVSCSKLICSVELPYRSKPILQLKSLPSGEDLVMQLKELLTNFDEKRADVFKQVLKEIVTALAEVQPLQSETVSNLKELAFVVSDDEKLYSADKVFCSVDLVITGKIQRLHHSYLGEEDILDLLTKIGVRNQPLVGNYIEVIQNLHKSYQEEPLSAKHLKEICQLVPPLSALDNKDTFTSGLYLPDQKSVLHPISRLCYNDVDWLPDEKDVCYVNSEIAKKHAVDLGIKSRRTDSFLKTASLMNENWISFGQHEELTTRIKNLIGGYSEPLDIFKEMIQNADDAGASEIEFILDKRQHGTEKTLSEKWEHLQGPALLIANNGKFTKDDLNGIQKLGIGSKRADPLKTGKYGVGFNTVYSLTDCPILLTKIDDDSEEDVMCMFDPHLRFADGAENIRPGCCFNNARSYLEPYEDIKSSFLFDKKDLSSHTLLRLVLRDEETANESKISPGKAIDIDKLAGTLEELKKYGDEFLLFLYNIKKIRIRIIDENGNETFDEVAIELYDTLDRQLDEFKSVIHSYSDRYSLIHDLFDSEVQLHRKHCVKRFNNKEFRSSQHWDVFEQVGFKYMDNIDEEVLEILEQREYKLIPKGGVAKPSKDTVCKSCQHLEQKKTSNYTIPRRSLFCTLPLEADTGIEGIINGNFALESSVRRSLYNCEGTNKKWNESILNHCVLPCFINHLIFAKKQIEGKYQLGQNEESEKKSAPNFAESPAFLSKSREINTYYKMFPTKAESTDKYFQDFTDAFYTNIASNNVRLLCVHKPGDTRFFNRDEFLLYQQKEKIGDKGETNLLKVMKMSNLRVDVLPYNISKGFEDVEQPLHLATSTHIRTRLIKENGLLFLRKETTDVQKTPLKSVENVMTLLNFCLKKGEGTENEMISLDGLPLCLFQNNTLAFFRENSPVFLTKFTSLFKEKTSLFVHYNAFKALTQKHIDQSYFKKFGLESFREMMRDSEFKQLVDSPVEPVKIEDHPNLHKAWLASCWKFIESQLTHEQQENGHHRNRNGDRKKVDFKLLDVISDLSLLLVKRQEGKEELLKIGKRNCISYKTHEDQVSNWIFNFMQNNCKSYEPVIYFEAHTYCKEPDKIYPIDLLDGLFASPNDFSDVVNCMKYALESAEKSSIKLDDKNTNELLEKAANHEE